MDGPVALACLLAALHHVRTAVGGRAPAPSALASAVMALGMAAMFVPTADVVPRPVWVAVFTVVLLAAISGPAVFGPAVPGAAVPGVAVPAAVVIRARRTRSGDARHHVVGAVAMLFMLLGDGAMPGVMPGVTTGGMTGAIAGAAPGAGPAGLLTAGTALALAAWFLADIVRLLGPDVGGPPGPATPGGAVGIAVGSRVGLDVRALPVACLVMDGAMVTMLLVMA